MVHSSWGACTRQVDCQTPLSRQSHAQTGHVLTTHLHRCNMNKAWCCIFNNPTSHAHIGHQRLGSAWRIAWCWNCVKQTLHLSCHCGNHEQRNNGWNNFGPLQWVPWQQRDMVAVPCHVNCPRRGMDTWSNLTVWVLCHVIDW